MVELAGCDASEKSRTREGILGGISDPVHVFMRMFQPARSTTCVLVVWLLLWVVAMGWGPVATQANAAAPHAANVAADHDEHCDDEGPASADVHAAHGTGAAGHCPLCLHAAASFVPAPAATGGAWASTPAVSSTTVHPRVRATVPPPARAPPEFS